MYKNIVLAICCCVAMLSGGQAAPAAQSGDVESTSVTVYPTGQALVTEVRHMDLPGSGEVAYPGAAATLDPTSVGLRSLDEPDRVLVRSLRVLPSAADAGGVLRGYVGRKVRAVLPDTERADRRQARDAVLLSVSSGRAVLDLGDQLYVGPLDAVLLPVDEARPRSESALLLDVRNEGERNQRVEVSYLAGGLDWSGDCALSLDAAGEQGSLSCWATLKNHTGKHFQDADLRLVAGEVHRAPQPMPMRMKMQAAVALEESMGNGAALRQAGDYHVFEVPFQADLAEGQTTRLLLGSAGSVQVGRELVVRGHARHRIGEGGPQTRPVENVLVLRNTPENGLGSPLPASLVRVYRAMQGGGRILEGETHMDDLPVGETVRLALGNAFDLRAERTMLAYERTSKHSVRVQWRIELRNSGAKKRSVMILETLQDDWKIKDTNFDYVKENANTVRWNLTVPPGSEPVKLHYTADISWPS